MSEPIHILDGAVTLYQRPNMKTRTYTLADLKERWQ